MAVRDDVISPDPIAFREDMAHMAQVLDGTIDGRMADYVALFLRGVARTAEDDALESAATELADARAKGAPLRGQVMRIAGLVDARLQDTVAI